MPKAIRPSFTFNTCTFLSATTVRRIHAEQPPKKVCDKYKISIKKNSPI